MIVGVIAALAIVAVLGSAVSPTAWGRCLPPLVTCPPPPPPASGPPQAIVTGVSDIRDTSATFTGEINPGGLTTTYSWGYQSTDGYGTFFALPNSYTLPAGSSWVPIQTPFKLSAGFMYSSLTLSVSNADGRAETIWPASFATPEHPLPRLVLRHDWVIFGDPFPVTVRVSGTFNTLTALKFYVSKYPFRRWRAADAGLLTGRGTPTSITAQPCFTVPNYQCTDLDRNFKLKATLGPGTTRTRLIYVLPYLTFLTKRENYGNSPWLDLTVSALVHRMRRYPHQRVYFYAASSRSGPYRRIGSARFRVGVRSGIYGTQLRATFRVYSTRAAYLVACFRHRLVRDMGPSFNDTRCGRPWH
jgi:hypothetical protein